MDGSTGPDYTLRRYRNARNDPAQSGGGVGCSSHCHHPFGKPDVAGLVLVAGRAGRQIWMVPVYDEGLSPIRLVIAVGVKWFIRLMTKFVEAALRRHRVSRFSEMWQDKPAAT